MKTFATEALVIGGGATGAGTFRDLCLRDIPSILLEKEDFNHGTSGRNHGLLHSGARYAVKDFESAVECIAENIILKNIAYHCIEETGGLFALLPEDNEEYYYLLIDGCYKAGIPYKELDHIKSLAKEPSLNQEVIKSILVPDGTIDPFRLVSVNAVDGVNNGGLVFTYTELIELKIAENSLVAAICYDHKKKEQIEIRFKILVNAAGIWSSGICQKAGIKLHMLPSGGSMLVVDYRINHVVLNRCRMPGNGDIIVPGDTVSIIGTTSKETPEEEFETNHVADDEVKVLLEEGSKLIPGITKARLLRAYGGVRPLIASDGIDGRNVSRGISLIDHARDNVENMVTISGGKLMTYRLMAEKTADLVAKKLKINSICATHLIPLPGSDKKFDPEKLKKEMGKFNITVTGAALTRHGDKSMEIIRNDLDKLVPLCECEMVTQSEIEYSLEKLFARDIHAIRKRTRMGMGPCQGTFCTIKTGKVLTENNFTTKEAEDNILQFIQERWKGIRPVLSGDTLREAELTQWIYKSLQGYDA